MHSITVSATIGNELHSPLRLTMISFAGDIVTTSAPIEWAESDGSNTWLARQIQFHVERTFDVRGCHGSHMTYESPRNTVPADGGLATIRARGMMTVWEFEYDSISVGVVEPDCICDASHPSTSCAVHPTCQGVH